MIVATVLALMAVVMFGPAGVWLDRSRWPLRAPRAAIALWQAIGINGALASIGTGIALAVQPLHKGLIPGLGDLIGVATGTRTAPVNGLDEACGLTLAAIVVAVLVAGLAITTVRTIATRRRHRILLDLVSVPAAQLPGTVLLRDPGVTAYCIPGVRPRIVVSDGAVELLDRGELTAVVDHERGHLHEHHDLALLPFSSMIEMLDWMPYVARAPRAVANLLEMAADDYAIRNNDRRVLASAVVNMAASGATPSCAFAVTGGSLSHRVERLVTPRPLTRLGAAAVLTSAAALVVGPLLIIGLA
jgi:Zn-dependent protease with chaperone function